MSNFDRKDIASWEEIEDYFTFDSTRLSDVYFDPLVLSDDYIWDFSGKGSMELLSCLPDGVNRMLIAYEDCPIAHDYVTITDEDGNPMKSCRGNMTEYTYPHTRS